MRPVFDPGVNDEEREAFVPQLQMLPAGAGVPSEHSGAACAASGNASVVQSMRLMMKRFIFVLRVYRTVPNMQ